MTIQPLVPYTQLAAMKEYAPKSSGVFATIKNFFTGKFFEQIEMHLLTAGTIYYVAKAALSFFSGYWMLSMIEFLTAGILSKARASARDYRNLDYHTNRLVQHDSRYERNNLEFKGRLSDMKGENEAFRVSNKELERQIQAFSQQMNVLNSENQRYSFNNQVHATLLDRLDDTSIHLVNQVQAALDSGQSISRELLTQFLTAMDLANQQKETLLHMKESLSVGQKETLDRLERVTKDVKEMNIHGVQALRDADVQLQATLQQIASLREEVEHLRQVREELKEAARINIATAKYLQGVASKVIPGPIKTFFSSPDQIFGAMCIAAIARHAFQLAT